VHLLLVEDDPRLVRLLTRLLGQDRHVVDSAMTASEGLEIATAAQLDAIILDVGLPDGSGFDVARRLRARGSAVPILMLTARDAVASRVEGLDAGADDYLVKPFAFEELSPALRALGRRPPPRRGLTPPAGPIVLDETDRLVTVAGRSIDLSHAEYAILECLLHGPARSSRATSSSTRAGPTARRSRPTRSRPTSTLRTKLGDEGSAWIETVRGVGYRVRAR